MRLNLYDTYILKCYHLNYSNNYCQLKYKSLNYLSKRVSDLEVIFMGV